MTMVIMAHQLRAVENCYSVICLDKGHMRMAGSADHVLPDYTAALCGSIEQELPGGFAGTEIEKDS
ncbi:hypothetical protein [Desulfovibrio desulfuricans]|uniref:hypothetical protein n=1 Tax=Desulfovibrio desulfuricans TaxID=876 RepID=UPI001454CEDE|nr:hypothetical protein [Desulfovibrio desulfuricans]